MNYVEVIWHENNVEARRSFNNCNSGAISITFQLLKDSLIKSEKTKQLKKQRILLSSKASNYGFLELPFITKYTPNYRYRWSDVDF